MNKSKFACFLFFIIAVNIYETAYSYNEDYIAAGYADIYGLPLDPVRVSIAAITIVALSIIALLYVLYAHRHKEGLRLKSMVDERVKAFELESVMLNTLFDSIPDVIFCKDLDLKYSRLNKTFEELFALKRSEVLGLSDLEALNLPAATVESWRKDDLRVLRENETMRVEEQIPTGDGRIRTFETIKTPIIYNNKVIGILGLSRDVTERKEIEDKFKSASRAKTAFIANMSHEIRTPMNSIVGFSELALTGAAPKTQIYLNRITENANWLLQIINDMLDISKIESGKVEFEYIPFDLKDLFDQCQRSVLNRATEKGIKLFFYVESQEDNRLLIGDPVRLRQIIINLLSNALKFTNVGMVRVTSFLKDSTDDSKTFYFEIRDSGIGMTKDQIDRIFEPFMQADTSITRRYGGTGLGLPITKNLISMMGGSLSVNSVKDVGSKFSFELVFKTVSVLPKAEEHRATLEGLSHPPLFNGEVLVCEDNEMNQLVVAEHLERVGLKTVIAKNGQIGVNLIKERKESQAKPFNLILMDIHMPVMDGLDAADKILALNTGTPIVAMTANIMTNDKDIYRQRGMKDCVGKPFTSKELWACLLKYLEPINL